MRTVAMPILLIVLIIRKLCFQKQQTIKRSARFVWLTCPVAATGNFSYAMGNGLVVE